MLDSDDEAKAEGKNERFRRFGRVKMPGTSPLKRRKPIGRKPGEGNKDRLARVGKWGKKRWKEGQKNRFKKWERDKKTKA